MSMSPSELNFRWLDCKSSKIINMVIWVVEFSREGYKIRNIFGQKSISLKGGESSKIGHHFRIEVMYQKTPFTKNVLLN